MVRYYASIKFWGGNKSCLKWKLWAIAGPMLRCLGPKRCLSSGSSGRKPGHEGVDVDTLISNLFGKSAKPTHKPSHTPVHKASPVQTKVTGEGVLRAQITPDSMKLIRTRIAI